MTDYEQLTPYARIDLDHRASYLAHAANEKSLLAASSTGDISIFDTEGAVGKLGGRWSEIHSVSLNQSGTILAVAHGHYLSIVGLDGSDVFCDRSPCPRQPLHGGFDDCFFDPRDGRLWCAVALSEAQFEVQLRESQNWSIVHRVKVDDRYGSSSFSFESTPHSDAVALWVAGGQDGQEVYWLTKAAGQLICTVEPLLKDTLPPFFSPEGTEFLTLDSVDANISRYAYPDVRLLGRCTLPVNNEESELPASAVYLDEQYAIIGSETSRFFLLNVRSMSLVYELSIEGHEPRPAEELYYPRMAGDRELCSDISYFGSFGDTLITVYRRDRGNEDKDWKDSLLLFTGLANSRWLG